jgi:hypothetical protein
LGGQSTSDISGDKTENSLGGIDYWIVKTDAVGNIQWQNTIGGNLDDALRSVQQTTDGGYIIGGTSNSNISGDKTENSNGDDDYWIVKTDSIGNIQWQNTIGGSNDDWLFSIQQTSDGGFIIGGTSWSNTSGDKNENIVGMGGNDFWIVKADALGNIQWQNTIGGSNIDWLFSIKQSFDGGYFIGGRSTSGISGDKSENALGFEDYWIVKTDSVGNIQWQNTIGGNNTDALTTVELTADGGYIIGGFSGSGISGDKTERRKGIWDYWVLKIDSIGNIQWQRTIGGSGADVLLSLQQTDDGGYIFGGSSGSLISGDKTENSLGINNYWVIKTDVQGAIIWQNTIGGLGDDQLASLQQTMTEDLF